MNAPMSTADYMAAAAFFGLVIAAILDRVARSDSREVEQFIQLVRYFIERMRRHRDDEHNRV